jgi:hypothetical protein
MVSESKMVLQLDCDSKLSIVSLLCHTMEVHILSNIQIMGEAIGSL